MCRITCPASGLMAGYDRFQELFPLALPRRLNSLLPILSFFCFYLTILPHHHKNTTNQAVLSWQDHFSASCHLTMLLGASFAEKKALERCEFLQPRVRHQRAAQRERGEVFERCEFLQPHPRDPAVVQAQCDNRFTGGISASQEDLALRQRCLLPLHPHVEPLDVLTHHPRRIGGRRRRVRW